MAAHFAESDIVTVNSSLYEELKHRALGTPFGRYRFCLHKDHSSPIQEMIIALKKDSYVQPHRHPDNRIESYSILEGELDVLIFDDLGKVKKIVRLNSNREGAKLIRIGNNNWHMPIPKSDWVIYHEILQGPFDKDKVVEYASWAPGQEKLKLVEIFLKELYVK